MGDSRLKTSSSYRFNVALQWTDIKAYSLVDAFGKL